MKKFILISTCILLTAVCAFAKKKESDQTVSLEKIINIQGMSKEEIFSSLDSSFLQIFNYPESNKESSNEEKATITGKYNYGFTKKMVNYEVPIFVSLATKDQKVRIVIESKVYQADKSKKGAFWGGTMGSLMTKNAETHYTDSSDIVKEELKSHLESISKAIVQQVNSSSDW